MNVRKMLLLTAVVVALYASMAEAASLRIPLPGLAGQVIKEVVEGGGSEPQPPPQQYQPQYHTQPQYVTVTPVPEAAASQSGLDEDPDWWRQDTEAPQADGGDDAGNIFGNATVAGQASSGPGSGGGNDGDTIEVVATGVGRDSDSALRNALRAAVEQAVGTLVDSETLAENDEVVSDKILSYSGGFVQSHRVLGEPRTQDGLVTVRIRAVVKKTELVQRLEAAAIHVGDIDGESLFGEAVTKLEQHQASGEIVKKAFEGFPHNVLEIRGPTRGDDTLKPAYDERTKKWTIPVEISVNRDKYRAFVRQLLPVLEKVAIESERVSFNMRPDKMPGSDGRSFLDFGWDMMNHRKKRRMYLICTQMNDAMTNNIWETYVVPPEALNSVVLKSPSYTVDIIDKQGDIIVSNTYDMLVPAFQGIIEGENYFTATFPLLNSGLVHSGYNPTTIIQGTPQHIYKLEFDVSPYEFKRMANVVCRINR